MPMVCDEIYDEGLDWAVANVDRVVVCSQEPTTFAEANATYRVGYKAVTLTGPADRSGGGREVTQAAITDGTVDTDGGEVTHYAWVNVGNEKLIRTAALPSSVTLSDDFALRMSEVKFGFPDPS